MTNSIVSPPPILTGASELLRRYAVVICDVWGVVHNGVTAYAAAGDALARFRAQGGVVVLLSNAPSPGEVVSMLLDAKAVRRDAWDALVTSGDITRVHVREQGFRAVHHIGEERDLPVFRTLDVARVPLDRAEAIVCTGLADEANETADVYRPVLLEARRRRLPLICANPDLVVEVAGVLYPCAGSIAAIYEEMGGPVFWAGKPHRVAYEMAFAAAEKLTGRTPDPRRVLAIGDAVRTDVAGAVGAGIDALMIGAGIHKADLMPDGRIDPSVLAALTAPPAPRPIAAMPELCW